MDKAEIDEGVERLVAHPRQIGKLLAQGGDAALGKGADVFRRNLAGGAETAVGLLHQEMGRLREGADLTRSAHIRVSRDDLFGQGRARTRQADDEDRRLVVDAGIAELLEEFRRERLAQAAEIGCGFLGRVVEAVAMQRVGDIEIADRRLVFADILHRLAEGEAEMDAVAVGQGVVFPQGAHPREEGIVRPPFARTAHLKIDTRRMGRLVEKFLMEPLGRVEIAQTHEKLRKRQLDLPRVRSALGQPRLEKGPGLLLAAELLERLRLVDMAEIFGRRHLLEPLQIAQRRLVQLRVALGHGDEAEDVGVVRGFLRHLAQDLERRHRPLQLEKRHCLVEPGAAVIRHQLEGGLDLVERLGRLAQIEQDLAEIVAGIGEERIAPHGLGEMAPCRLGIALLGRDDAGEIVEERDVGMGLEKPRHLAFGGIDRPRPEEGHRPVDLGLRRRAEAGGYLVAPLLGQRLETGELVGSEPLPPGPAQEPLEMLLHAEGGHGLDHGLPDLEGLRCGGQGLLVEAECFPERPFLGLEPTHLVERFGLVWNRRQHLAVERLGPRKVAGTMRLHPLHVELLQMRGVGPRRSHDRHLCVLDVSSDLASRDRFYPIGGKNNREKRMGRGEPHRAGRVRESVFPLARAFGNA